jgi:transposase InsO family protein
LVSTECQIDTGATVNVMGYDDLVHVLGKKPVLDTSLVRIKAFGGADIRIRGETCLKIVRDGRKHDVKFQITDFNHKPLISADTSLEMNLIKVCYTLNSSGMQKNRTISDDVSERTARDLLNQFADVFDGLGKLNKYTIKLEVDENVAPIIQNPRRVPVAMRKPLEEKITELLKDDIIAKVERHTDWVSNVLIVKRNDKLRLCLDPIDLNRALKCPNYQMPTLDEILPDLSNAKVFTTLDAKQGFWQLCLDEPSSFLTTFWTPQGRFRWKRVPFGISPAPEIYQKVQNEIIEGLKNVKAMADDLLVYGCGDTFEEALIDHNINLKNLLNRLRAVGLKLNKDKVKLAQTKVTYFGHVLSSDGVKVDPRKVDAIAKIQTPKDKKQLMSFLGMVTYLTKFLPNLSNITGPLRELTHDDTDYIWKKIHQQCFENIKKLVQKAVTLAYFDVRKRIVIQCDASDYGLGAVLLQEGKPVAFASRALTKTEKNYAVIEKETLAVLFACNRFFQYIICHDIKVETDHQALEIIFRKPLLNAPKRLQRMLLNLQRFKLNVKYIKGSRQFIADALSRLPMDEIEAELMDEVYLAERVVSRSVEGIKMTTGMNVSDQTIEEIKSVTNEDDELCRLATYITRGWPQFREVHKSVRNYHKYRDELATQDGLLFKANRIIIPAALRTKMLSKLHRSHGGVVSSLRLARDTIFWPGMTRQVTELIASCLVCAKNSTNQPKEEMQSYPVSEYPFEQVSMDLFEFDKKQYFLMVDHFSDFFEVELLHNMEANTLVKICKKIFARFGTPKIVYSDNAKYFVGGKFQEFATAWGIKMATSSPYHSQGNGKAESAVKICKQLLHKAKDSKEDIYRYLLAWRNTPNEIESSPAQRLIGRRTRNELPLISDRLQNEAPLNVKQNMVLRRRRSKYYYDRNSRNLPALHIGEPVFVKMKGSESPWTSGKVKERRKDRSYDIEVNDAVYRRNRNHVRSYNQFRNDHDNTTGYQEQSKTNPISVTNCSPMPTVEHRSPLKPSVTEQQPDHGTTNTQLESGHNPATLVYDDRHFPPLMTRSGRAVVRPSRFNDYEMVDTILVKKRKGDVMLPM